MPNDCDGRVDDVRDITVHVCIVFDTLSSSCNADFRHTIDKRSLPTPVLIVSPIKHNIRFKAIAKTIDKCLLFYYAHIFFQSLVTRYSTDIRQKSRFSQDSVQTNSNLTIVQPESCVGSTFQRHVTNLIRIG